MFPFRCKQYMHLLPTLIIISKLLDRGGGYSVKLYRALGPIGCPTKYDSWCEVKHIFFAEIIKLLLFLLKMQNKIR